MFRVSQPPSEHRLRVGPGDWLHTSILVAKQRLPEAIGVVDSLNRRLTTSAKASAVDRMLWIAFRLRDPAVDRFHHHAAAGRALAAGGRVKHAKTRRHIVRGDEVR